MASKPKEKVIPHYLRASTGSCHDICKYGKKQEPVEKPWRSTTKKIFKKASDVVDLNDICKYGKREIPVEKPWRSTTKKTFKKGSDDVLNETSTKPASSRTKKVMEAKKEKGW